MNETNDPLAWVNIAEEDYNLARASLSRKQPMIRGACFHAQQCAEKYLKAMLVARKQPFPKTHDLRLLNNLCSQAGIFVELDQDLLDLLTSYAIWARYPGDTPSLDEAQHALQIVKVMRHFARQWLGIQS